MRATATLLATALVAALLLSGCSGKSPAAAAGGPDVLPVDGTGARAVPTSFDAPVWKVGQWWEWETFFGTQSLDFTYCSIVVGVDGSSYTVATERSEVAKDEAAFGMPLIGSIGRADLAMEGWGGDSPWSLLSFPLTDGKTWTATMPNIAWDIVDGPTATLDMAASFSQPTHGELPLVNIEGKAGGALLVTGAYDPASGWFRHLAFLDTDPGEEAVEVAFHAKTAGTDYTGPYFIHQAAPLLELFDGSGFTADPTQGGQPFANPEPQGSFTMEAGTRLYGGVFTENVLAAREIALVPPQGEPRHLEGYSTDLAGAGSGYFIDEPSVPGEWRVATAGAGGYSQAFVRLYELTEGTFQM